MCRPVSGETLERSLAIHMPLLNLSIPKHHLAYFLIYISDYASAITQSQCDKIQQIIPIRREHVPQTSFDSFCMHG